jgi:hypothetical protein
LTSVPKNSALEAAAELGIEHIRAKLRVEMDDINYEAGETFQERQKLLDVEMKKT